MIEKIKKIQKKHKSTKERLKQVISLSEEMSLLQDDELRAKTKEFKIRYKNGESLEDLESEAFAVAREASKRVIGKYPYEVQVMGALAMQDGDIAEMKTGEGKTLTAVMAVYLNALSGDGVHVVTANEYLSERDAEEMGNIYRFLGMSVGVNLQRLSIEEKKIAYNSDITYTTNTELGFDYLRDNMVYAIEEKVQRGLNVAFIDEVDSILIDEARTPLIIAGMNDVGTSMYEDADTFVRSLKANDYEIDLEKKQIFLTDIGIKKAEGFYSLDNLYEEKNTSIIHSINQALKAHYIMKCDVDYMILGDSIVIIDPFTGRIMEGRTFSEGLHQAIEAKEKVAIRKETKIAATITYQNFFRLYNKIAGMSGTAKTDEDEFLNMYNMRVIEIPTNKPVQRVDLEDRIFGTKKAKYEALCKEISRLYKKGQPVLIGTISIETSEFISDMLKREGISHEVLNAKNHAKEAKIISRAGQVKSVTIATNMGGRGTDIKLSDEARKLGGLVVLGSERHESRRIDNQLRGRSGRQGDPGYSQFYVSMEDDLIRRFGEEKSIKFAEAIGNEEINSKFIRKAIKHAQKKVEGQNFDARKYTLEYDDVLRVQRQEFYSRRDEVLKLPNTNNIIKKLLAEKVESVINENLIYQENGKVFVDLKMVISYLEDGGLEKDVLKEKDILNYSKEEVLKYCINQVINNYEDKIKLYKEEYFPVERTVILMVFDEMWMDHISAIDKLKKGIHLRRYSQVNPLYAYIQESKELFEVMRQRYVDSISKMIMSLQVSTEVTIT